MIKIHALLVAAGLSQRMGRPKQLLPWGTETLIVNQIKTLQAANLAVSVVLGANPKQIQKNIEHLNVHIGINEHWQLGMGNSIACGVKNINSEKKSIDGILIALVDQPMINARHFRDMLEQFEPGNHQIIVSQSKSGITGPPVLFDSNYFEELKGLHGDEGAKSILKKYKKNVVFVEANCSLEDMDTPDAYQKLLHASNLQF